MQKKGRCTRCLKKGHGEVECSITLRACTMCRSELHHKTLCPKVLKMIEEEMRAHELESSRSEADRSHSGQETQKGDGSSEGNECDWEAKDKEEQEKPMKRWEEADDVDDNSDAPRFNSPADDGNSDEED